MLHIKDSFFYVDKTFSTVKMAICQRLCRQINEWGRRSLIVIGTADPHYNQAVLDEIQGATNSEIFVIEGADHSLEIEGDVLRSLDAMEKVVRAIQAFVTS